MFYDCFNQMLIDRLIYLPT